MSQERRMQAEIDMPGDADMIWIQLIQEQPTTTYSGLCMKETLTVLLLFGKEHKTER